MHTGPVPDDDPRPSARDLVRKRRGDYRAPETGRHHHIGAAPERTPVHTEGSVQYAGATRVQLADRTRAQLQAQRERLATGMTAAAQELDFELAASLRDDLAAVDAELATRGVGVSPPAAGA